MWLVRRVDTGRKKVVVGRWPGDDLQLGGRSVRVACRTTPGRVRRSCRITTTWWLEVGCWGLEIHRCYPDETLMCRGRTTVVRQVDPNS